MARINKALDTPCNPTIQAVLLPFNSGLNNLTIPALKTMRQEDHKCEATLKKKKEGKGRRGGKEENGKQKPDT